jgi:hypothetical protein
LNAAQLTSHQKSNYDAGVREYLRELDNIGH